MRSLITKIVNIYTLLLMTGFTLFMSKEYYNVLNDKLYFFLYTTIACLVLVVLLSIGGAVSASRKKKKPSPAHAEKQKTSLLLKFRQSMRVSDWFAAAFLVVTILSTACSRWTYEAFWGNMGRYQGCFIWIFYICAYFLISRWYRPKHWHVDVFLLTGLIVCIWGVLDYYWLSPIGWQDGATNPTAYDFSSTIGNVNTLTGLEGMYLLTASVMFCGLKKPQGVSAGCEKDGKAGKTSGKTGLDPVLLYRIRLVYYFIAAAAAFLGLTCGMSDNAMLAVAGAVCFLPFFAFRSCAGIVRYLQLLAGCVGSILPLHLYYPPGMEPYFWKWGELLEFANNHSGTALKLFAALLVLTVLVWYVLRASGAEAKEAKLGKILRIIWGVCGVIALVAVGAVLADANAGGHPELYAPYSRYLIFDENWGTNRGFNWSLAVGYIRNAFTPFELFFGAGPETYAVFTYAYDYNRMRNTTNEIYDSPHNELLQYLFSTGILGFIAYYGLVISAMTAGFRAKGYTNQLIGAAFAFGVLAYTLTSVVNISSPITVPTVIMSIAICVAAGRKDMQTVNA